MKGTINPFSNGRDPGPMTAEDLRLEIRYMKKLAKVLGNEYDPDNELERDLAQLERKA